MSGGCLYFTLILLSSSMCYSVFIKREQAHHVLRKRANHFLEEIHAGNLERECYEETCSKEEAREIFKSQEKTTEFWYHYKDLSPCKLNPCENGGICQQYHYMYTCLCPPRFMGRHCENVRHECWYKNGGCWQYCTDTPRSMSVTCSCAHGYSLNTDGKSCEKSARFPCGLTISSSRSLGDPDLEEEDDTHYSHPEPLTTEPSLLNISDDISDDISHQRNVNETTQTPNRNETVWGHKMNETGENSIKNDSAWMGLGNNSSKGDSKNETVHKQHNNTAKTELGRKVSWKHKVNTRPQTKDRRKLVNSTNNISEEITWPEDNVDVLPEAKDSSTSEDSRIVGGIRCELGHCPWQVMIRTSRGYDICSGSLISSRWVLSAAHCFEAINPHHVTVGDYDKMRRDLEEQKIGVLNFYSHPNYYAEHYDHDIALLYLRSPVIFSDHAQPICLPTAGLGRLLTQEGGIGQVSGWGATRYLGPKSRFLMRVRLPIVSQEDCIASTKKVLTGNMFCAGYHSEEKDACQGDSGGPFAVSYHNTWYLTGVVSWGEGCAADGKYGVFTRVSSYIPWIKDTIIENDGIEDSLVNTL
ncbi:coagulation factor VII-like isoform X1 [Pelobates fuscus]|uniref:coagulation factor VII-like isoform X1 n=2 Tax=Pelobates fuscus TaxID=191477 RepID=UPI002FE49559